MIDKQGIDEKIIDLGWKNQRLLCSLKIAFSETWIDLRKWKPSQHMEFRPSDGMFLKICDWMVVMPILQKMIDENCNSGLKNEPKKM